MGTKATLADGRMPSSVSTALHCLKLLCSSPFTRDAKSAADWISLLQSTLATVLDYAKSGGFDFMENSEILAQLHLLVLQLQYG